MKTIDLDRLDIHRRRSFGLPPARRVSSPAAAREFVNRRGFVFFWPIKGIDLPSLWVAAAGDRPVADEHDDPGHITWRWKDNALGRRIWYYAKVLRHKATMISLETAPYFYALSENYGNPEEDYLLAYEEGRLTQAARQMYEALLENGPLHTIDLRKAARLENARESEFNKALETLQGDFKILPVGVARAGAWKYSFIYEIVARHYPGLAEEARAIGEGQARQRLAELYFQSVGAAQARDVSKLFGWPGPLVARTLARLIEKGILSAPTGRADLPGEWYALAALIR
ncbi:MAG TPA: crosslink repair DNA glycosylase YcaQ family protein [Anaerolineales bacterium]